MKNLLVLFLLSCFTNQVLCQVVVEKHIPIDQGQLVKFDFTWPKLISIKSWSGNEIKLIATVDINKGQNDDAFKFIVEERSGEINIASLIEDYKSIPKKIVFYQDGQEYFFNTDDYNSPEILKFKNENGDNGYEYMNYGVITNISIEVWLPSNVAIDVYSKFGMIEVVGLMGKMNIHSKFGGIDLSTTGIDAIKAGTKFGEKYTDLPEAVHSIEIGDHPGKWDWVLIGNSVSASQQELKSEFGNIYIRRL